MEIKLTNEKIIKTPQVEYQLVADFGEDGTSTIWYGNDEATADYMLDKFVTGDYTGLDIDEDDIKDVIGVSLQMTLEAPSDNIQIVTLGNTSQAWVELYSAEVEK